MRARPGPRLGPAQILVLGPIYFYRWTLGWLLGGQCRFYPSCSSYALAAVKSQGALKGSYLTLKRILRCHPWHAGGYDPAPSGGGVSFLEK